MDDMPYSIPILGSHTQTQGVQGQKVRVLWQLNLLGREES